MNSTTSFNIVNVHNKYIIHLYKAIVTKSVEHKKISETQDLLWNYMQMLKYKEPSNLVHIRQVVDYKLNWLKIKGNTKHIKSTRASSSISYTKNDYYTTKFITSRAPDKLRICVFYAMKMSKNACIIRSECTHYTYILLCKQTFQIRSILVQSCT